MLQWTMRKIRCYNCRTAKVLCDTKQPCCTRCLLRGKNCAYPAETAVKFVNQNTVAAENSRRARRSRVRPSFVQLVLKSADGACPSSESETPTSISDTVDSKSSAYDARSSEEERVFKFLHKDANPRPYNSGQLVRTSQSPILSIHDRLSQNKSDPFDAYGIGKLSPVVQDAINYAYENLWPYSILSPDTIGKQICLEERHIAVAVPFWFHTSISQASAVWLNFHPLSDDNLRQQVISLRREHTIKALKIMRQIQAGPDAELCNIVLTYGAFRLSVQPYIHGQHLSKTRFPTSPLAKVQHLHVYGSMDIMPGFTDCVAKRIKERGGLPKFASEDRMPTSRIILLADIIVATRRDQAPTFDWPFDIAEDRVFASGVGGYGPDAEAMELYDEMGHGFRFLTLDNHDLKFVVDLMIEATVVADHYHRTCQGNVLVPGAWQVGRTRNLAQYHLSKLSRLELVTSTDITARERCLEMCRLALLLFSDMVLFPIPETTDVKPYLRANLRKLIEVSNTQLNNDHDIDSDRMLTWIVTVATLASLESDEAEAGWWQSLMLQRLTIHGFGMTDNGENIRKMAKSFLWWGYVFDPRLEDLYGQLWIQTVVHGSV